MAKKRQSSQSVRQNAKRRAEEARKQRNDRIRFAAVIVVAVAVLGGTVFLVMNQGSTDLPCGGADFGDVGPLADLPPEERNDYYERAPEMGINPDDEYEALIRTERGDLCLQLFAKESPLAVNNFVFLARQGFYDGTVFHRVIEDFMAQGGDPTGTGAGGPGYQFADEVDNGLVFDRPGLLAMANRGANTNGSQFFITYGPTAWLNGAHTIFGELIAGEDVLNSLTVVEPGSSPTPAGDLIERVAIIER